MKNPLYLLAALAVLSMPAVVSAGAVEDDAYFHFNIGGDFAMSNYEGRDPRFVFGFDAGNQFLSLPVSFSYAEDLWIIGAKPRVQYLMAPIANMPNLRFGPGLGPVLNFWYANVDDISLKVFELGAQISGHIQYVVNDQFSIMLSPLMMDLNFWRYASVDAGSFGDVDDSETELRIIYSMMLGVGLTF